MKEKKVKKIDFSRKRLAELADKYYNEGKFVSALRLAYRERDTYGEDGDVLVRLSDIYEGMGLQGSAINCWFRFLDIAEEADLPDIYEGLAVNYLAINRETESAFYYNRLIDADDTLPEETKLDIAEAFAVDKRDKFRFVYPPQLADYSREVSLGSKALKTGDCKRAIEEFSKVEKGSKEYASAKEMQAVAHLLAGETEKAEQVCLELLKDEPNDLRAQSTLAAVYLEQGKTEESRALALELAQTDRDDPDDLYKVATVCCENGLDGEAYRLFEKLDKKMPYDGRMLYFKAVSAYKSGHRQVAEDTLDTLCTIYPDAEVAKYYLKALRRYDENSGEPAPELIYFYHLPQEERENRCKTLIKLGNCAKDEAQIFGLLAEHDGYFRWCFDEMDGGDHDLQYLGLVTAVHVRADLFIQDILLDFEVLDVLKVETLRMLLERNEEAEIGLVLCNIYRRVRLPRIEIGRKRRKKFVEAFAKIASKFVVINDAYGKKIKTAAERLYRALEAQELFELADGADDCACAIYLLSGLKELGNNMELIAAAFDAKIEKVEALTAAVLGKTQQTKEEKSNEID
ncbi:MAG: hypothetical protein IJZ32_01140 [Clostridia bacterium]|nr:hypothetical protein [Clostridia bacterium]